MNLKIHQLNFTVGDMENNFLKIKQNYGPNFQGVHVYSELALTGYPPNDLLLRKDFIEEQNCYLEKLVKLTFNNPAEIIVGCITENNKIGKPLFNSAVHIKDGKISKTYNKQLLPTYNIFDESRYFEVGKESGVVFNSKYGDVGILICEDCFDDSNFVSRKIYNAEPLSPYKNSSENIEAIITLNASPSNILKHNDRYDMYRKLSKIYKVPFVYVNQVGGNDELIFDGHSFYVDGDDVITMCGFREEIREANQVVSTKSPQVVSTKSPNTQISTVTSDKYTYIFNSLEIGLKDYFRKNGFTKAVVGASGGIDSALVIALAAKILGEDNIECITMPSKFSSEGSITDSKKQCDELGINLYTMPIGEEVELAIKNYTETFQQPKRLTIENIQPRIRARKLMEYSNDFGALVLNTSNKSESSMGYFSILGDTVGGISVIGDLYKTEVYTLAKWMNNYYGCEVVPKSVIDKEPSAELWGGQVDTDSLPPYHILDNVLKLYLEGDLLSFKEKEQCFSAIKEISIDKIEKIINMVEKNEYKRRIMPPILRVNKRSFGFGRNIPIAKKYKTSIKSIM